MYLTNACEFWSLSQDISAAKVCFLYSLSPIFAVFFSYIHFKEKMSLKKWLGLGIGLLGFIPVLLAEKTKETAFFIFSWSEIAIFGAAIFSVYGWIILRLLVKDNDELSPLHANGYSMVIGSFLALAHSFLVENWAPVPGTGK